MRRLVVEASIREVRRQLKALESLKNTGKSDVEFANIEINSAEIQRILKTLEMLQNIKSIEMLHILRFDQDEFAAIIRVEVKNPSVNIKDLFSILQPNHGPQLKMQLIDQEKEGAFTYFIKGKLAHPSHTTNSKRISMYPLLPFGLRDGKIRVTLLGDNSQVKEFLEFAEKTGFFRVVSLMDAKFSPVGRLTERQRDAIILAFKLGYFDTPRKISTEKLATKLDLASSTLAVHLRRAERRILADILSE
jgi:predicted DNA binding protein